MSQDVAEDFGELVEDTFEDEDVESPEDDSEHNLEDDDSSYGEVDLDEIADTAIEVIQSILKPFDIGDITIDEYEGDEGELILDITGDDLAVLIGRHGRTLDAMQFMVSAIVRRRLGYRYPIVVDVEGYKNRQRQKIESLARTAASRAVSQHREIKLRPMTPYERRIVHVALSNNHKVSTESEGEGPNRHVVIIPH